MKLETTNMQLAIVEMEKCRDMTYLYNTYIKPAYNEDITTEEMNRQINIYQAKLLTLRLQKKL